MIFGMILRHEIDSCSRQIICKPVNNRFSTAVDVTGEQKVADEDVTVVRGEQMIALDHSKIIVCIGEAFRTGVVAEFEVREIQVYDSRKQVHGVAAAVHVGIPNLRDVQVEFLKDRKDVGEVAGWIAADPVDVF